MLQVLPRPGSNSPDQAWRDALADLDAGKLDLAILPHRPTQVRFHATTLYPEDFVFVTRKGHPLGPKPTAKAIASSRHVLVSATGDTSGNVDRLLAERGLERRIALTVPSFLMAICAIASSDLIGALPRGFSKEAARTYDLQIVEPPFSMLSSDLFAIVPQAAMLDQGIAWLLEEIETIARL